MPLTKSNKKIRPVLSTYMTEPHLVVGMIPLVLSAQPLSFFYEGLFVDIAQHSGNTVFTHVLIVWSTLEMF